jgi:hypothetical protein
MPAGSGTDADVARHRAAFLRHAGHVEHGAALVVEVRGHAEQRADREHSGAADSGDQDVAAAFIERHDLRLRQGSNQLREALGVAAGPHGERRRRSR